MMRVWKAAVAGPGLVMSMFTALKCVQWRTFVPYKNVTPEVGREIADPPKVLKLLQLNVFWRPWILHMFKEEYVHERALLLAAMLDEYDIVCLNEAFQFGSSVVSEFVDAVRERGFKYVASSHQVPLFSKHVIDSGAMIISKYPIIETDSVTYSDGCSWDRNAAKGPVYAKVAIGGGRTVNVFTTHLQASYKIVTDVDFGVRVSQSKVLQEFIQAHTMGDDSPTFLLGDMNIDSRGEGREYLRLIATLQVPGTELIDALKEKGHPVTIAPSLMGSVSEEVDREQQKSIDYVFIYEGEEKKRVVSYEATVDYMTVEGKPYPQVSDHYGVRCVVNLP